MDKKTSLMSRFLSGLCLFFGVALLVYAFRESSFYRLSPAGQALHENFDFLRSSGLGGLSFGMIGTGLIFLNLTYLLRRHLLAITWLGTLRTWMALHVFTGLIGGMLILLHSTFHPKSTLGWILFISLLITIATGVLGRYIYSRVPRSLEGQELELDDISRQLGNLKIQLEKHGFHHELFEIPKTPTVDPLKESGLLSHLMGLLAGNRELTRHYQTLKKSVTASPQLQPLAKTLLPLAKRFCEAHHWFTRYYELRSLMGSWRFLHRWFAILMLITVIFHVWVAIQLGDLWILRLLSR